MANEILIRVPPERCTGKFTDDMWVDPNWIAEEKLDGSRYTLYFDLDGTTHLYSRRDFPRIDRVGNVPHLVYNFPIELRGTVLDGEIKMPGTKYLSDTTGIMNMLPANAVGAQRERGWLRYTVFDLIYLQGIDMRPYNYKSRRVQLEAVVKAIGNPNIHLVDARQHKKREYYDQIVEQGGEGIVLKHIQSRYGEGWVKRKKFTDVTVFVIDFQRGRPGKTRKYEDTLGALILGAYNGVEVYEIGKCSGMDDATRDAVWENKVAYMFRPCDVRTQELSAHGRLREPRFIRWRDDLDVRECTVEGIVQALNSNTSDREDLANA